MGRRLKDRVSWQCSLSSACTVMCHLDQYECFNISILLSIVCSEVTLGKSLKSTCESNAMLISVDYG